MLNPEAVARRRAEEQAQVAEERRHRQEAALMAALAEAALADAAKNGQTASRTLDLAAADCCLLLSERGTLPRAPLSLGHGLGQRKWQKPSAELVNC